MNCDDDMFCPHCGQVHPIEARFCPSTGQPLPEKSLCPKCGSEVQADWIRCVNCGWDLKTPIPPSYLREARQKRQITWKWLTCGIAAVIIVVGIGAILWQVRDLIAAKFEERSVSEPLKVVSDTPLRTTTPARITLTPTFSVATEQTVSTAQLPLDTETPTVTPSPTTITVTTPWIACPNARPSQLSVGMQAYISDDPPVPNRVRALPSTDATIWGWIYSGETVEVLDGPACSNSWVWWKVRSLKTGLTGWTAEGDQDAYWLLPLP